MPRYIDKLTEEQKQEVDELIERVLENGAIELEIEIEMLGSVFCFRMPTQKDTEEAMDEAGRDTHGLRDAYTREVLFSRLILSKALISVDDVAFDEIMARSLLLRLQPGMIQALFLRFIAQREAHNLIISGSIERTKKSQPNPAIESDGK